MGGENDIGFIVEFSPSNIINIYLYGLHKDTLRMIRVLIV